MHFELSASWNSSEALSQRQVLVEKKSVFPLRLNYERKLRMSKRDRDSQESKMADGDLNEEELPGNFSSMQLKRRTFCPIHFQSTNRQLLPLSRQNRSPRWLQRFRVWQRDWWKALMKQRANLRREKPLPLNWKAKWAGAPFPPKSSVLTSAPWARTRATLSAKLFWTRWWSSNHLPQQTVEVSRTNILLIVVVMKICMSWLKNMSPRTLLELLEWTARKVLKQDVQEQNGGDNPKRKTVGRYTQKTVPGIQEIARKHEETWLAHGKNAAQVADTAVGAKSLNLDEIQLVKKKCLELKRYPFPFMWIMSSISKEGF